MLPRTSATDAKHSPTSCLFVFGNTVLRSLESRPLALLRCALVFTPISCPDPLFSHVCLPPSFKLSATACGFRNAHCTLSGATGVREAAIDCYFFLQNSLSQLRCF
uniref:Uncharacterized protein n=1 Tax=Eutreptiella gymnastica TaxID=73025 RepID=A0A7S4G1T1_9EUGL